jgi:hypothetical protein
MRRYPYPDGLESMTSPASWTNDSRRAGFSSEGACFGEIVNEHAPRMSLYQFANQFNSVSNLKPSPKRGYDTMVHFDFTVKYQFCNRPFLLHVNLVLDLGLIGFP